METIKAEALDHGVAIPAHPLALDARLRLDEARQQALTRYYVDSGAGGVAVGVHTTQFRIHDEDCGLYQPVLTLAAEELDRAGTALIRVAGVLGPTSRAVHEAEIAAELGYDLALVAASSWGAADEAQILDGIAAIGEVLPVFGFYLQPAVGGRHFSYRFWRSLFDLPVVRAVKIAPFDRYRTLDVTRALADSGHAGQVALYTGNDDSIVADLLTPFPGAVDRADEPIRIVGGLLGQFAVWTGAAVELVAAARRVATSGEAIPPYLLTLGAQLTDANAAIFDSVNGFRGSIAGIHEVLRRDGLLDGVWCLDPEEALSPGQVAEIDRVWDAYPHLRSRDALRAVLTEHDS